MEKLSLEKFDASKMSKDAMSKTTGGGKPTITHHCDGASYNDKKGLFGIRTDWDRDGDMDWESGATCL